MLPRAARLTALFALVAAFAIHPRAHAQAAPTAVKAISISAFGGVAVLNPEFGPEHHNIGFTAGADITRPFFNIDVSFEIRYTDASGTYADEDTYGGGFKFSKQFRSYHPYVNFLIEEGQIHFDHPELIGGPTSTYTHDDSTVYDAGAGVDYDLRRNFALKLDAQFSTWKIGSEKSRFTPYNASVGIVYYIPFRASRRKHR